jgi:anti-sigma factor RsiW
MNCRAIEPLLLAERDGVLTSEQHAALAEHVAGCPACRRERQVYGEAVTFLKTDAANIAVPNIDEEWRAVRARLRAPAKPAKKPRAPLIWFGAPLAAAAALAAAFFVSRPVPSPQPAEAAPVAYVDGDSGWLVVWAADADPTTSG